MANEIWTIKRCLEWTKEYLAERGEEHPRLSAEWLLCAATGLARIDLYMRMDETLDASQLETMHAAVVRRAKGEPLQYITGSTQFRMIDVACAPGVLIPRPETEMLVEEVLNYLDAEVLSPEAAARQRVELPWNDEVEQARKAEAALADERAAAERRAANLTAADEAALGSDVLGSRAYAEELADREAEEAAAQAAEAEAAEAEAMETPEPELDEYGIAIEDNDQQATPAQDAAEANVSAPTEPCTARVLEVGCGTGCISLSLAWERRGHVTCTATDIEPRAIDLATKNRDALGLTADEVAFSLTNLVSSIPREDGAPLMCSSPTRLTSRPTSCARCRTRSRTLSPTWRSRAAPTASIFSAACSMRRLTCCAPAACLPASSTRVPSMPRPSSVARQAFRTCVSSMTSPIAPASSEPSSPSPNSVFKLN